VLTDIPGAPRTLSGVISVEILTNKPYEPGLRWRETRKMFGIKATEEMMVAESEPPGAPRTVAEHGRTEYTPTVTIAPDPTGPTPPARRCGCASAPRPHTPPRPRAWSWR